MMLLEVEVAEALVERPSLKQMSGIANVSGLTQYYRYIGPYGEHHAGSQ